MATGWIAWTCLLMAANTGVPDDVWPMNQRGFQIPIRLKRESQAQVKELHLHLSRDQGRTWEPIAKATPDKRAFDFTADADGTYWFNVSVVYKNGMKDPEDISRAPVGQKVLIDTLKPDVRITSAKRLGEEIEARWEVIDANPDWNSLRLAYRMSNTPTAEWVPVQALPGAQGMAKFRPPAAGDVTVRLQLKDLAGNEGAAEQVVSAGAGPGHVDHSVVGAAAVGPTFRSADSGTPPPPTPPPGSTLSPPLAVSTGSQNTAAKPPVVPPPSGQESSTAPTTTPNPGPEASLTTTGPTVPRLGALPELKIINKKQAKLDFDVVTYGPSGLGGVDVYLTTDEGANWAKMEGTPEVTLPVSAEARSSGPVRGSVTVQLPRDEVVYGFYVVVKSRAGLCKRAPAPGTAPHVRIEVDTKAPKADLFRPQPEGGQKDSLRLVWKAEDKNLQPNPISLEWSANKDGPWELIGGPQLPNTGHYTWQITERVPPKVYLRLTVRDVAGNVAVAQTSDPVLIDLTEPEIANVGVSVR